MSPFVHARCKALILTIGCALILLTRPRAADKPEDPSAWWSALPRYRLGQDAKPLQALEALIRANQDPAQRRAIERQLTTILDADATADAKHWACRQLWYLGTDASVPSLSRLLADESCVEMACYALGRNPSPAATRALAEGLTTSHGAGRIVILNTLADRGAAEAEGEFVKLASNPDASLAAAAIRALGLTGTPTAAEALRKMRASASPDRLAGIADALLRCARLLDRGGKRAAASAVYMELLSETPQPHIRRGALLGLVSTDPTTSLKTAATWIQSNDASLRAAAVAAFRAADPRQAARTLTPLLRSASQPVVLDVINILVDSGGAAAASALAQATRHPDVEVRLAAARAAGLVGNETTANALLKLAASPGTSAAEKEAALAGLRATRGNRIDEAIVKQLASAPTPLRSGLIGVLADRGSKATLPTLAKEAASGDVASRRAAIRAIARLGDPAQSSNLLGVLATLKEEGLRDDLEQALIEVCRRSSDPQRWAEPVLAGLKGQSSAAARNSLLRVLGGLGGSASLARISEALKDPDQTVQETAFRELANWPSSEALDLLRGLFKSASQPTRRALALRGYARLLAQDTERPATQKIQDYKALMDDTSGPDERKLVLAGLGELSQPAALDLALPCLADEATRTEACLAVTRIALAVAGAHPERARQALEKVVDAPIDAAAKEQASKALAQLDAQSSWLTSWQVSGPYAQDGKNFSALFDIAFPPEVDGAQDVKWRDLPAGTDAGRPFLMDLLKALGGEQRVAYVRTFLHAPKAQEAVLELGSDDGAKAWLNGKVVHANNIARPLTPDSDKAGVALQEGSNVLLIKVTQNNLGWEFTARLRRPDGRRVEGLRQSPTP